MFPFYTPWKHQKILGFWCFQGGIKWEHWPEIGYEGKLLNKPILNHILLARSAGHVCKQITIIWKYNDKRNFIEKITV